MSDAVFLTGGTGFLGMELIGRLLERDEGPDIFVAVRARDAEEADERVTKLLAQLYDDPPASASRLRPVRVELTEPELGLGELDAHGTQPRGAGRRVVVELCQQLGDALIRLFGSAGAHRDEDVRALVALEQPSDELHPEEAGAAGEKDRVAHASAAPIAW